MVRNEGLFRNVQARALRDEIADSLREAILFGKLAPGQRLTEISLARDMGVSRFPVREAIRHLEQQRLLTVLPNQGARVINPTKQVSYQALALRMYLETLAARMAATRQDTRALRAMEEVLARLSALAPAARADPAEVPCRMMALDWEFHCHLIQASGSEVLSLAWSTLGPFLWAAVHLGTRDERAPSAPDGDVQEDVRIQVERHQRLLDAVRSANMDVAEKAVRTHRMQALPDPHRDAPLLAALRWDFGVPFTAWEPKAAPAIPGQAALHTDEGRGHRAQEREDGNSDGGGQ